MRKVKTHIKAGKINYLTQTRYPKNSPYTLIQKNTTRILSKAYPYLYELPPILGFRFYLTGWPDFLRWKLISCVPVVVCL
jgi:hypothetical protein